MKNKFRPVEVSATKFDSAYKGMFHCWGKEWDEFENGAVESSIAIIELLDGRVKTCSPERITFLDGKAAETKTTHFPSKQQAIRRVEIDPDLYRDQMLEDRDKE